MKYFITNTSMNDELLDDEILSPNESRVLDKVNLSTLPSAFTVKMIKEYTKLGSLGNGTSQEDISGVEKGADEDDKVQNTTDESLVEKSIDDAEGNIPEVEDILEYLNTLSKDDLKKILTAKEDSNCTARSEWKIAQYIKDTYPECTKEDFVNILGE